MFSTPEGSFKPTVIFFGLTNSLATFQTMMNDLLRDLVVEEKVVVFIDDVMVATETEERHDETVEEVLRRLEENDLFVKLEKCVWKVREVGFGSNNRGRRSKNGKRKDAESNRVAGAKECEGCTEVFGIGKLLQMVCQRFCKDSKVIT